MEMIDIHCHILPGLDDGADSDKTSLKMIRMAMEQGITSIIATSHYSVHFRNDDPQTLKIWCCKLQNWIHKNWTENFRIYPGLEILYSQDVPELLKQGKLQTMADSRYVLIEFFPDVSYTYLLQAVRALLMAGYWPILAHVERYGCMRVKERPEEVIKTGAYLQMNYRQIGGKWYDDTTRWCRSMLKKENIHFLGTDMHNTRERSPDIRKAVEWMNKHLDKKYFQDITYSNPQNILINNRI